MSLTRCVALAVAVGCVMDGSAGDEKPRASDDAATKAFVAYLGNNGVKLEADKWNWWVATDPKRDGYKPWA